MVASRAILEIQCAHKWYDFDLVISDLLDLIIRLLGLIILLQFWMSSEV